MPSTSAPVLPPHAAVPEIVDAIARDGYAVVPAFLPGATIDALRERALALDAAGKFAPAGLGHRQGRRLATGTRGDRIAWLDETPASPDEAAARAALDALRVAMNHGLMLGLERLEAHFAIYPPGAGYARHLDRFHDDDARVLSFVLYLNRSWEAGDGGALRLHLDGGRGQDVLPEGGRLVLFLAGRFEHEVLPARRPRVSLAGWFSRRQC